MTVPCGRLLLYGTKGELMKSMAASTRKLAKSLALIVGSLWILAHLQVHASVGGAAMSASLLAVLAGVVALLVLLGIAVLVLVVSRELGLGIYRPRYAGRHAS